MRAYLQVACRILAICATIQGCSKSGGVAHDPKLSTLGTIEVTAKLVDTGGEFPPNDLYDYAHVMKYEVQQTHRGKIEGNVIYVGHYNPLKARNAVADERVKDVGGNVTKFIAGDVHRMALVAPIDEHFMGGIVNKLPESGKGPIYWALWTERAG
ncbi:MAG: hypothetical protein IT366_07820 [Candidatus Hydrogenedentes bacterium]|nr:hypothetical protein [Candidatus Hydrogenedentota bacterium]